MKLFPPYLQLAPRRWGTARTELGSSHSSWKGSRLLATPATAACLTCRPDIVCPNRLGGMMQPAKAAHGAFLARRKLAASGSSRAPCAFPNLRCDPRCWLFSCLGLWSHPHISPKEHQKERCGHFSAAALLHYVLWCASEYSVVGRISCHVPYDSTRTNVCQRSFAEFFLTAASESNRSVIYISLLNFIQVNPRLYKLEVITYCLI